MKAYEYRHIVGFEETNLVGNVYYAHHVRWQGKCREMFLRDHTPSVLSELSRDLRLVTLRTSCEYHEQLRAFDEVAIRMRLGGIVQNRIRMLFDYVCLREGREVLAAKGEQEVACLREGDAGLAPCPVPEELRRALEPFA